MIRRRGEGETRGQDGFSASPCLRVTVSVLFLAGCVPVPPGMLPQAPAAAAEAVAYPDIEPTGVSIASLHFKLRGYHEPELHTISSLAEDIYNRIGMDTGLYSFLAGQSYALVVYKDSDEYTAKTKQPAGSRAVASGGSLYTYAGPDLAPALAHHIMHMVFNSYMGDKAAALQWLNEGLALREEVARMTDYERTLFQTTQNNQLRSERMPFSQMVYVIGTDEQKRRQDLWYLQAESVVSYLSKQGSSLAFAAFLGHLRSGATADQALSSNYAGKFDSLKDL